MQNTSGRRWAYFGVFLGFAASITANIASTVLTDTSISLGLRVPFAVFWPLATYVAIEVLVRTDWDASWSHRLVRLIIAAPVGFVAAFVSYLHQHHLMILAGESGLAQAFGPLAVDGMLFGMTATLIVTRVTRVSEAPEVLTVDEVLNRWGADLEPEADWDRAAEEELGAEMLADSQEIAPVSPAAPRRPRSQWDAYAVCTMALEGVKASVANVEAGIGQSTYGRYLKVARILKENPRAEILPAEKVPAEHVQLLRELCSK